MSCKDAMIQNVISVKPEQTVEEVMNLFDIEHIRSVPVVDDNNKLLGLFSLKVVLDNLLPVAAVMEDGLQRLDFIVGATPGIAKRLVKLKSKKVGDIMFKECVVLHEDTPTWEAVRVMARYGSPIPIIQEKTGVLVGMISSQSLLAELRRILQEMNEDPERASEE